MHPVQTYKELPPVDQRAFDELTQLGFSETIKPELGERIRPYLDLEQRVEGIPTPRNIKVRFQTPDEDEIIVEDCREHSLGQRAATILGKLMLLRFGQKDSNS